MYSQSKNIATDTLNQKEIIQSSRQSKISSCFANLLYFTAQMYMSPLGRGAHINFWKGMLPPSPYSLLFARALCCFLHKNISGGLPHRITFAHQDKWRKVLTGSSSAIRAWIKGICIGQIGVVSETPLIRQRELRVEVLRSDC